MRRLAVLLALSTGLVACVTPSIPIPPPDPTEMTFHLTTVGQMTTATFEYPPMAAYAGGLVQVFDLTTMKGVSETARADGSVGPTLPLPAMLGDNIDVSITSDKQTVATCIVLREGAQDPNVYCQ
jgi:hypothetical protein